MRSEVANWLENLDDDFLAVVHAMVGTYVTKRQENAVFGYDADGTPL
jgi:hypothetical protein